MPSAKDILVKPIKAAAAKGIIQKFHYSGKTTQNSQLHFGVFIMRKHYPQLKWVVSFADGCQCGDGTIYRASGFVLTAINKNSTMAKLPSGEVVAVHGTSKRDLSEAERLKGFQLRYIYFLDKSARDRLTVPEIPFSEIDKAGAGMYKGEKRGKQAISGDHPESGGAAPTSTLQSPAS